MAVSCDTLEKAARHFMLVVAECPKCRRVGKFFASDLVAFYGRGRDWRTLPFKCEECGTKATNIRLEFPDFDRTPEKVVWRPTKVKR